MCVCEMKVVHFNKTPRLSPRLIMVVVVVVVDEMRCPDIGQKIVIYHTDNLTGKCENGIEDGAEMISQRIKQVFSSSWN